MLIWEQPHPILMAELRRRSCVSGKPVGCNVTELVANLAPVVEASALFMASYATKHNAGGGSDGDGKYHLGPPTACQEEGGEALGGGGPVKTQL